MAASWRMTMRSYSTILVILLVWSTNAVDRSNFKTCDQTSFCKRHRDFKPPQSPYIALLDTVQANSNGVELVLLNKENSVKFKLEIYGIQNNIARMKINEYEPMRPRYEVRDALVGIPPPASVRIVDQSKDSFTVEFDENKLVVRADPFQIMVYRKDTLLITVNSRSLLLFEHYRHKRQTQNQASNSEPENNESPDAEKQSEEDARPVDEYESWEESFKSHTDSRPYGPASVGLDIGFPGFQYVYGIPEHADSFALRSTKGTDPYRLYNLDVFEYELNNPMALYGSVPFMVAHNEQNTVGVFWHNAAETWIDITSNIADKSVIGKLRDLFSSGSEIPQTDTHWISESGIIDVFLMLGSRPADVFRQYTSLTGVTELPPLFSIAYHQCRWNYNDEEDVAEVDRGFDEHDIPYDVIWLDIEHTDGKRYFTWDVTKFPHSEEMLNNISAKGRKMVTIVDPHLKRDDGYFVHQEAKNKGYYIKDKNGNDYEGWCWPGSSNWPDFLNPEVQEWWASKFALDSYKGSTMDLHVWNDMNEPSVFSGPEITLQKDAKHFGNWEHRDIHNVYGMLQHQATANGLVKRSGGNQRPFVLSRAFYAGSQRAGAIWTGDNLADWSHLKISVPMLLSTNLVGIVFSGADVGGFFKNVDTELLVRWYQAGAYQPFFRAHAHLDTKRREPWLFGEENTRRFRDAIRARYSLLPFWYTEFWQHSKTGMPVMRPLWVNFPSEKANFDKDDIYMLGDALLVRPITEAGVTGAKVTFPGSNEVWYDVRTYQKYAGGQEVYVDTGLDQIPVFQRGGTIVPRKERIRRSSALGHDDPYTLIVALKQGASRGTLYIDDYKSYDYKKYNNYLVREFVFNNGRLQSSNADANGKMETKSWLERVIVVGLEQAPKKVELTSSASGKRDLEFTYDAKKQLLTIRKPATNMGTNWTISLL